MIDFHYANTRDVRMDRGNRRILVASTLLTIPLVLMIGTNSGGAPPTIGKLPSTKATRPGLLQTLAGNSGNAKGSPKSQSGGGLLEAIVGSRDSQQANRQNAQPAPKPQPANWEGIPYHSPNTAKNGSRGPIRDPGAGMAAPIRSKPRTINAIPASARTSQDGSQSILIQNEPRVLPMPIPTPPQSVMSIPTAKTISVSSNPLSDSSSSRRSDRRKLGPLDANEINIVAKAKPAPKVTTAPKQVAKRTLPTENATKSDLVAKENTTTSKPVVASAKPVESAAQVELPKPEPTATDLKPAPKPEPLTAVETIAQGPVPSAEVTSKPEPELRPIEPSAPAATTLSVPTPAVSQEAPQPIPMAGIPSHQFSARPSEPAAHRAGPPNSAFEPRQSVTSPSRPNAPFNTASSPIGSGVAPSDPNRSGAIFRKPDLVQPNPTGQPPYVAQQPQYGSPYPSAPVPVPSYVNPAPAADPYAARSLQPPPKPFHMNAQPLPPTVANDPAIPMHPIANHRGAATPLFPQPSPADAPSHLGHDAETVTLRPGETSVASELPGIRVVTHGPSSIMIRQTHQFEIRVENRGSIDADGVMVRALIPDWAEVRGQTASRGGIEPQDNGSSERLVWTIDQLPAGATERMFVRLKAERSGTHGLDVDWTLVPQKSVAQIHVHEPKLKLSIEGPNEVVYGQSQTYKVRVLNPGDGIAPGVVFTLSPNSATPQTQRIGDIPAGKEAQFEVELTAQDLGDLKIHGLASGGLELRAEATKTIRVAAAKLEAILTGPELKYQDTESEYHLQIKNSGVATSEQIVATLRLPAGVQYLDGLDGAQQRGSVLSWNLDSLTPGAIRDYDFRCKMTSPGDQVLLFDCKGTAAGIADVSIATRVESISDLVLTINDPIAPAPVGREVIYEIIIRNRGSKEATDVRAIAQFSNGIEPRRVEGHSGELLTGQVLFDSIPRIGAGDEVRLKVVAEADTAGHHRFRSEIRSGDTVLVAEEATHYMSPRSERVSRHSNEKQNR